MSPLRATKTGLTVCVALGVFLFLYLWVPSPEEATQAPTLPAVADCGFYPDELCSALFVGKLAAPQVASFCQSPQGWDIAGHLRAPRNCSRIYRGLHFITRPLSAEEANFSLAYVLTVPKELAALVRLLRAIYVPQNVYCVHMGDEAPEKYQAAVQSLVGCFENVFISPKSELETSGGSARLRADLDCLRELVQSRVPWNYAINLGGEDFPLRTNREIIRYLRSQWNEKNITPGAVQPPPTTPDANQSQPEPVAGGGIYVSPNKRFGTEPPHNLTIYFGSPDYVLTRKFVQFVLSDPRAKALLHWSRDIQSPEHHYWVTLNRLRDAPGATPDAGWEGNVRATKWKGQEGRGHNGCKGRYVQDSCVYGLGDLPWIIQSPSLFASKFEPLVDPLVVMCLERRHRLRMLQDAEVPLEPHWRFQHQTHFNWELSS